MQGINSKITENFKDNIEYIEQYHPELFDKLSALDTAIANGDYKDKYELMYENDGFDVLEKATSNYLYAKESLAHTLAAEHSINKRTDNYTFEGFVRHSDLHNSAPTEGIDDYIPYIADIISFTQREKLQTKELHSIDKYIFFGIGLGMHIESIANKINAKVYFLVEDDLELFRLSLFTINYKELASKATLIFSVFEQRDTFMASSALFLETKSYCNHYLKFFHLLSHKEEKIQIFQLAVTSQPHIRFRFNDLLLQYTQPLQHLFSDYILLQKSLKLSQKLQELPFLLLASGPSLEKNIAWLQEHHKEYITIAVSSSLSYLEHHKIAPNIVLHIDPFECGITTFEKLKSLDFLEESLFLLSATSPHNIVSLLDPKKLFFFETGTAYREKSLKLSSPCVGSMALQILLILQIKNIYLLGLDMAVDPLSRVTHAGEHQSIKTLDTKINSADDTPISFKESLFDIKGNLTQTVETTPGFYSSIYIIEYYLQRLLQEDQKIYNLSDGAYFSHTLSTEASSLRTAPHLNQKKIFKMLTDSFRKRSLQNMNKQDKELNLQKLSDAKELLRMMQEHQQTQISAQSYIESLYQIFFSQEQISHSELTRVLHDYMHYIASYIYDYFNLQGKEVKQEELKQLHTMLMQQMQKLTLYYITQLQRYL